MREFDELDRRLAEDVSQLPPAPGEMDEFSPFSFAVFYLVAGLAMRTITLQFFNLQYILPMVGTVLLYLGFRSLRRENRWFGGAYVLSALLLVWQWAFTVLLATPLGAELEGGLQSQAPSVWMAYGSGSVVNLALFLCLRQGLRGVWHRLGRKPERDPMLWAMVWYAVLVVLAYVGAGTALTLGALVWWVLILRSLWKAGQDLEKVGYSLQLAPVRLSRRAVGLGMLAATLIPILVLSLVFARTPAQYALWDKSEPAAHAELQEQLAQLGFPEEILADLSPEDLAGYEGTLHVTVAVEENLETEGLELVSVYAVTSERSVRVLHWYRWVQMPFLRLGDALECNMPWDSGAGADDRYEGLTGRMLYDREGRTYASPMLELDWGREEYLAWWGEMTAHVRWQAGVALPLLGSNARGYVVYDYYHGGNKLVDGLSFNYFHQTAPVLYPWQEPAGTLFGGGPFEQGQNYSNLFTYRYLAEDGALANGAEDAHKGEGTS